MGIRAIPRTAVDGAVKLARFPLDFAISLMPGDGSGARPAAGVAVDRHRCEAARRRRRRYCAIPSCARTPCAVAWPPTSALARTGCASTAEARGEAADARFSVRVEDAEERRTTAEAARAERAPGGRTPQAAAHAGGGKHGAEAQVLEPPGAGQGRRRHRGGGRSGPSRPAQGRGRRARGARACARRRGRGAAPSGRGDEEEGGPQGAVTRAPRAILRIETALGR